MCKDVRPFGQTVKLRDVRYKGIMWEIGRALTVQEALCIERNV